MAVAAITPVRYVMWTFPLTRDKDGNPVWNPGIPGVRGDPKLTPDGEGLISIDVVADVDGGFLVPFHSHYRNDETVEVFEGELHLTLKGIPTNWKPVDVVVKAGERHIVPETVDHGGEYVGDRIRARVTFDPPHEIEWVEP